MTNSSNHNVVRVTPEMARKWLNHNKHNRTVSQMAVKRYRADMIEGRWQYLGDPIRFDVQGNLLDGQHRLFALAACPDEIAIPFLIIAKLPTESQQAMDQGRRRSPGDQLGLLGIKDANAIAGAVRLFLAHNSGLLFRDNKAAAMEVTTTRVQSWCLEHEDLLSTVMAIPNYRMAHCPPSVSLCAAILFVESMGGENAAEFFRLLHVGTGEGHPINSLDRRLRRIKDNKVKASQRELLALFIQAANAWVENRTVTKFQMPRGGKWTAETFPRLRAIA